MINTYTNLCFFLNSHFFNLIANVVITIVFCTRNTYVHRLYAEYIFTLFTCIILVQKVGPEYYSFPAVKVSTYS